MTAPIRPGTAKRLGLKLPREIVYVLQFDPEAFSKAAQRLRETFKHLADTMTTGLQAPIQAMQEPNSCRWCAVPEREHYRRWKPVIGWHQWTAPTDEQRKARMWARRAARR